jgi:HAE1 family hydrophobic/amphiphilic exporter-1
VIGGLLVSTLLTLIVIPVVYELLDRRSDVAYRERGASKHKEVVDAATLAAGAAMS